MKLGIDDLLRIWANRQFGCFQPAGPILPSTSNGPCQMTLIQRLRIAEETRKHLKR